MENSSSCSLLFAFSVAHLQNRPTHTQQLVRSIFHTVQFGAGYMLMLLAMYYNGGIIFVIFVSSFKGTIMTAGSPYYRWLRS